MGYEAIKDHAYLTDLGWTLVEAGNYEEVEDILKRAISISPDYNLAKVNPEVLHRLIRMNADEGESKLKGY